MRTVQPSAKVCAMRRNLGFAAAFALLLALAAPVAEAQKSGGILIMSHFDSPASMSMHEEATGAVNRPMMGAGPRLMAKTPFDDPQGCFAT